MNLPLWKTEFSALENIAERLTAIIRSITTLGLREAMTKEVHA